MMTNKQRFLTLMNGDVPDALPLLADLSYWYTAKQTQGTLEAKYEGDDGYIRLHKDLGVVYYYDYTGCGRVFDRTLEGASEETVKEGLDTVFTIHTRSGELSGRERYVPASYCNAHVEYMVKNPSDLKIVREFVESYRYSPCYDVHSNRQEYIGEIGVPISAVPRSPLNVLMADFAGVEATAYLSVDDPEEFEKTLECIDEVSNHAFELACKSPAHVFHFCDNLSAENVGHLFGKYLAPYYCRRIEQLHKAGKQTVSHLDGTIKGLLAPLAATGLTAIEALTPKPVGDVAVEDLRSEAASDSVILWGGLAGALFSPCYDKKEIQNQVDMILKKYGRNGRFIPGTADQIPPDADIELVKHVAEELETRSKA